MGGQFRVRLMHTKAPAGEIDLRDLACLADQLQMLATRVGRWVAGIDRVGRSTGEVEEAVGLRLTGLHEGSTVLEIERGPASELLFELPLEEEFDRRLWETLGAIGTDAPREDTPPLVRESALGVLDAFRRAAGAVELSRPVDGARIEFRTTERDRNVWVDPAPVVHDQQLTLSGVIKAVDLAAHKFRLHDDVGNRIPLEGIDDPDVARELLDRRTDAVGFAVRDARGRICALKVTSIQPASVPREWTQRVVDETWRSMTPGPDPDGGVEFSDDEWSTFVTAVMGG
jgi:hypothetical protein